MTTRDRIKYKESARRYAELHKEEIALKHKIYRETHREQIAESARQSRIRYKERKRTEYQERGFLF